MDGEITVDNIIMIFMDMECMMDLKFKYRAGLTNNFSRMKIKNVVIFPAVFSKDGFVGFLISNAEFMFILTET